MQFTNKTWYRVARTFAQAIATTLSALLAQGAFHSATVTTIVSAIVLFVSTALMNLEDASLEIDSDIGYNGDE